MNFWQKHSRLTVNLNCCYKTFHCVKCVRIRSYSCPHFPVLGTMQENADQNISEYGHFQRSVYFNIFFNCKNSFFSCWFMYFVCCFNSFKVLINLESYKDTLHEKWSFPLRIFSVNVTKSAIKLHLMDQNFALSSSS